MCQDRTERLIDRPREEATRTEMLRTRATRPPPAVTPSRSRPKLFPWLHFIIHSEDVEFLCRRSETGGTPTPPGVGFVRYTRSCGLGFHATGPQTPRIAVRAVFRARTRLRGSGATRSARGLCADTDGLAGRHRVPGSRVRRGSRRPDRPPTKGKRPAAAGDGDGVRKVEHPAARRSCGGPENRGVRGGAAPRQPPQGMHGVWPQGVSGAPEAEMTAGNHVSLIRTARSAIPAVGLCLFPLCGNGWRIAIELREFAGAWLHLVVRVTVATRTRSGCSRFVRRCASRKPHVPARIPRSLQGPRHR